MGFHCHLTVGRARHTPGHVSTQIGHCAEWDLCRTGYGAGRSPGQGAGCPVLSRGGGVALLPRPHVTWAGARSWEHRKPVSATGTSSSWWVRRVPEAPPLPFPCEQRVTCHAAWVSLQVGVWVLFSAPPLHKWVPGVSVSDLSRVGVSLPECCLPESCDVS